VELGLSFAKYGVILRADLE